MPGFKLFHFHKRLLGAHSSPNSEASFYIICHSDFWPSVINVNWRVHSKSSYMHALQNGCSHLRMSEHAHKRYDTYNFWVLSDILKKFRSDVAFYRYTSRGWTLLWHWISFTSMVSFNPSMDKYSYTSRSVGWNYPFIPILQQCNRWRLGMDR